MQNLPKQCEALAKQSKKLNILIYSKPGAKLAYKVVKYVAGA